MRYLQSVWSKLRALLPRVYWELLSAQLVRELELNVALQWQGLYVEWPDRYGVILAVRPVDTYTEEL